MEVRQDILLTTCCFLGGGLLGSWLPRSAVVTAKMPSQAQSHEVVVSNSIVTPNGGRISLAEMTSAIKVEPRSDDIEAKLKSLTALDDYYQSQGVAATLALVRSLPDGAWKQTELRRVFWLVGSTDPARGERLLADAPELDNSLLGTSLRTYLWASAGATNPESTLFALRENGGKATNINAVFHEWASRDYSAALSFAQNLPTPEREKFARAAAVAALKRNPMSLTDPAKADSLLSMVGEVFSVKEPYVDVDGYQAARDPAALGAVLAAGAPADTLQWLNQKGNADASGAYFRFMFQDDPTQALELIPKLSKFMRNVSTTNALYDCLAQQKMPDLIEQCRTLTTTMGNAIPEGVFRSLSSNDPLVALEFLRNTPTAMQSYSIPDLARSMAKIYPTSALSQDTLSSLPPEFQSPYTAAITKQLLLNQPLVAWDLLNAGTLAPPDKVTGRILASQLGEDGVRKIFQEGIPNGYPLSMNETLSASVSGWAKQDPFSASKWLQSQPAGDNKDRAILGLVEAVSPNDYDSAQIWADSIASAEIKSEAAAVLAKFKTRP